MRQTTTTITTITPVITVTTTSSTPTGTITILFNSVGTCIPGGTAGFFSYGLSNTGTVPVEITGITTVPAATTFGSLTTTVPVTIPVGGFLNFRYQADGLCGDVITTGLTLQTDNAGDIVLI